MRADPAIVVDLSACIDQHVLAELNVRSDMHMSHQLKAVVRNLSFKLAVQPPTGRHVADAYMHLIIG